MKNTFDTTASKGVQRTRSASLIIVGIAAIFALVTTFILASSPLSVNAKAAGFAGTVISFLVICIFVYIRQERSDRDLNDLLTDEAVDVGLNSFEEIAEFFTGSFRRADVFRLIFGRLQQILPVEAAELLLLDETRTHLVVTDAEGLDGGPAGRNVRIGDGLAGDCFSSSEVKIGKPFSKSGKIVSGAAIPLRHGSEVFGVLQLFVDPSDSARHYNISLFKGIGNRVSPLILSSIAFERSVSNALTDATTDLPNERAFHLILENQVAESQRKGDERPLTILAIDIKNFDEINQRFGHIAGDRALNFAANSIKNSLRQMDFFARSRDDEFLVVLPTATRDMSQDIVKRIQTGFSSQTVNVTENHSIEVGLNFGWAAFGADGDTPEHLLRTARLRKKEAKSNKPGKVLWFPHELVG